MQSIIGIGKRHVTEYLFLFFYGSFKIPSSIGESIRSIGFEGPWTSFRIIKSECASSLDYANFTIVATL
jgi:hypothetical protein